LKVAEAKESGGASRLFTSAHPWPVISDYIQEILIMPAEHAEYAEKRPVSEEKGPRFNFASSPQRGVG
jgi:hypothetical protein